MRIERDFCVFTGKPTNAFGMNLPISIHRRKRRTRFLPSGALSLVAPPYLSPLSGESTKHLPTFEKSLGVFSLNSPSFTRACTRTSVDFKKKPSPFTTLPYFPDRQTRRGEGFCIFTAFTHASNKFTFFTYLFRAIGDTRQMFTQKVKRNRQSLHT